MAAGRGGQEGAGLGQGGSEREAEGRQHPKVSRGPWDGREAVTKETKSVSHQARGAQRPLGGIWLRVRLVWLHPSLERGCEIEE